MLFRNSATSKKHLRRRAIALSAAGSLAQTGSQQTFHHLNVALNHKTDCTLTA